MDQSPPPPPASKPKTRPGMSLKQWLLSHAPAGPSCQLTHVLLCGGRAAVPLASRDAMLDAYAADVAAGRPLHVVECTMRGAYRMFADLDLKADTEAGADALLAGVLAIALDPAILPPQLAHGRALVCSRRWTAADGKIGAHVVWSGVRVDDASAAALRDRWVLAVAEAPVAGRGAAWWDAVIDRAVYRSSGLRMPWSLKRGGCAAAAYVPSHVVDFDAASGMTAIDSVDGASVRRWLELASLRACSPGEAPGWDAAPYGPASPSARVAPAEAAGWAERLRELVDADADAGAGSRKKAKARADGAPPAVRSAFDEDGQLPGLPDEYRGRVTGLLLHRDPPARRAPEGNWSRPRRGTATASLASRSCRIAGREHASNHVYLVLHSDGRVTQRCHSRGCEGEEHELPCRHRVAAVLRRPVSVRPAPHALQHTLRRNA